MTQRTTMTNSIVIEKNVPVPERQELPGLVEALKKMEIGDSFFLKMDTDSRSRKVQSLRQRITRFHGQMPDRRFRVGVDQSGDGMRVWRVA